MKKLLLFVIATALLLSSQSYAQTGVAINTTGNDPDNSAMLDVSSTDKGILIPRVDFNNLPASPATGLLVYVSANGPDGNDAFYYYDGTQWQKLSGATGLENFTESNFTYDSKTGVKLTPDNAAGTVDFVLQPKGYGAILAQQPDGTTTGGNKRGDRAVDLQMYRLNASQVANGISATISGGYWNTASAQGATVGGGSANTASSFCSTVPGGSANIASGEYSFAGGRGNTSQSYAETVIGVYATVGSGNQINSVLTDRLFVIGNGSSSTRSNALTILKNANATIGGSLTLNGNGTNTSITFPTTRGTNGQVLQTDGSGNTSWSSFTGSQWTTSSSNIYYNAGNVGIGTTTPNSSLTFDNSHDSGFDEWSDYKVLLYTDATPQKSYGIGIKANTLAFNSDRDYDFDQDGSTVMTIQEGKVGIGTESPYAPLDLGNAISNRKILLYSAANNDHQFTGLGLNADALRFQLATTAGNFKFYGATSSTASTELFRIEGDGDVVAQGQIKNVTDPTDAQDVATKAYVDVLLARIEALEETVLLNNGFTDSRDGTHYDVVKIDNQIWMAENLAYLPSVVPPSTGSNTTPYYYVYDYNGTDVNAAKATSNYITYGVLYNWAAAMNGEASSTANPSGVQGACPTGWHLPSDDEWTELTNYLGGTSVAGGKLKETGTTHWNSPNTGATNETGFTALPGGFRFNFGAFNLFGSNGYWWSATEGNASNAWFWYMGYDSSNVFKYSDYKEMGMSVRCVKD
ncbi:MAG: hypothetical protein K9G61_03780 [Bacteroidales bacterium]|nr:hypothetical protein [Bacteroidales bacterium]